MREKNKARVRRAAYGCIRRTANSSLTQSTESEKRPTKARDLLQNTRTGRASCRRSWKGSMPVCGGTSSLFAVSFCFVLTLARQNQLSNIEIQREQKARQVDPSIGYALDWLKIHATELEAPVCRPAIVSLNVRDQRYAWQIEACLSRAHRNVRLAMLHSSSKLIQADLHLPVEKRLRPNAHIERDESPEWTR